MQRRDARESTEDGPSDREQARDIAKAAQWCELALYASLGAFVFPCLVGYLPGGIGTMVAPWLGIAITLAGLGYGIAGLLRLGRLGPFPNPADCPPGAARSSAARARSAKWKGWVGVVLCGLLMLVIGAMALLAAAVALAPGE